MIDLEWRDIRFDHLMDSKTRSVLIWVGIAGLVVYLSIALVFTGLLHFWRVGRRAANQAATVENLKTIVAVETQYSRTHDHTFATFQQLATEQLISKKFGGDPVATDGYVLTLTLMPCTLRLPSSYVLTADPPDRNDPSNHFYVDSEAGQIHINPDRPAGRNDPLLEDSRRLRPFDG